MQKEIILKAINAGTEKGTRPLGRLFVLSILAGMFVSLGGLLSIMVGYGFPEVAAANPGIQKLLSGLMFPLGLFLIVMFGADLFTGNNALLIPAMNERKIGPANVICNWSLVWIGNFIGCLLFAFFLAYMAGLTQAEPYNSAFIGIAETKTTLNPWVVFFRGIGANWCVCLAVWLALGVNTIGGKALACWLPVGAFVVLGYEHCIANMFFIPCGMLAGADVSATGFAMNLFFATAGNIVGGALMVGSLFHKLHR